MRVKAMILRTEPAMRVKAMILRTEPAMRVKAMILRPAAPGPARKRTPVP